MWQHLHRDQHYFFFQESWTSVQGPDRSAGRTLSLRRRRFAAAWTVLMLTGFSLAATSKSQWHFRWGEDRRKNTSNALMLSISRYKNRDLNMASSKITKYILVLNFWKGQGLRGIIQITRFKGKYFHPIICNLFKGAKYLAADIWESSWEAEPTLSSFCPLLQPEFWSHAT